MGGYIKRDVERVETTALNTKVNKEILDAFKDYCKEQGYPLNVMLESFMRQYAKGRFPLEEESIRKWKSEDYELDTLNTTFNKEIYLNFKTTCKSKGFFVKHVIIAFMEKYISRQFVLEYVVENDE